MKAVGRPLRLASQSDSRSQSTIARKGFGHITVVRAQTVRCALALALILVVSDVVASSPALAETTYHVDQAHPLSSDTNSGAKEAPFRTIQKAARAVRAGDTVIVKSGTYNERITFRREATGEAGKKVTFRAEPPRTVTMWGFSTANASHVRIEGFRITVPAILANWDQQFGVFIRSDFIEVVDNYFFDIKSTAIQGDFTRPWRRNAVVARNRVYRCQRGIVTVGDHWIVEDNEVERLVQYTARDADYSRFFGDGTVFRNNKFHGTLRAEIGGAHVDCWQTFNKNGEYATNTVIEGNVCRDAAQGVMIEITRGSVPTVHSIIVRNNIFSNLWAWGVTTGSRIIGLQVFHNVFADIRYHGLGCRGTSQCEVRNNIFYNAGSSYFAESTAMMTASNNIVYRTDKTMKPESFPDDFVNVDPSFVAAERSDFHLRRSSPAIDAGTPLPSVAIDRDRVPRPQGRGWDIGPYEVSTILRPGARESDNDGIPRHR